MRKSDDIEFSIIGAGRFGQFWGKRISKYYPTYFYDINPEQKKKIVKFAHWDSLENCLEKKFIFLTVPIGKMKEFLKNNANKFKSGSVMIDCASVKVPVLNWLSNYLPQDINYVASHPLFGPDSARNKLRDHIMVLMPGRVTYKDYRFLVQFFTISLELHVYNLTAEDHDKLMAYNLNLVHHLGRALNDLGITRLQLMMSGMEKLNEIVNVVMHDTQELFNDFYKYNPYSKKLYKNWQRSFDRIFDQLKR